MAYQAAALNAGEMTRQVPCTFAASEFGNRKHKNGYNSEIATGLGLQLAGPLNEVFARQNLLGTPSFLVDRPSAVKRNAAACRLQYVS